MAGEQTWRGRGGELAKRLGWFIGLWIAGVATLGLIALIIRLTIGV